MGGVGEANGKLLLFGEHAAVYGHVAVGVSLPERTTVRLDEAETPGWDLDGVALEDRSPVARVLARMEPDRGGAAFRRGRTVRVESSIPRGLGFGSSAALCVACARALLADRGEEDADAKRVWALAHDAEHLFHGWPSGVDTGIALLGGTCVLKPTGRGLPEYRLIPPRGVTLVAAAVRRDESCAALIAGLAERMKAGDRLVAASIEELGRLSQRSAALLQSGGGAPAKELGELADAAMRRLRGLGLATPELDLLLEAARRAGSRGGKLSGGGGGGAFYAVAPDEEAAAVIGSKISEAAQSAGIALLVLPRVVTA
jgi:mevalonate kinase